MQATLHYIYDPLCGWCYGAAPLVSAAEGVDGLSLMLHGGGLWPEPTRLPEQTRRYIQQADARIAAMSGQPFGDAYLEELLLDPTLVLESRPAIAAILAAGSLQADSDLAMLRAIQTAHYVQGRRVVEDAVLTEIAEECGLGRADFESAFRTVAVDAHIAETRQLMARIGANGFPTFVLSVGQELLGVPHQNFASAPDAFAHWLVEAIGSTAEPAAESVR